MFLGGNIEQGKTGVVGSFWYDTKDVTAPRVLSVFVQNAQNGKNLLFHILHRVTQEKMWKTLWKVCKTSALSGIFPWCSVHRNVENSCQEENCRFFIFCALNNDMACRTTTSRSKQAVKASKSAALRGHIPWRIV